MGRAGPQVRRHRRRRRVRDLRTRRRHHRSDQLILGCPGRPRRTGRVPGRRHARFCGSRALRLPHSTPGSYAHAGVEPGSAHDRRLPQPMGANPRQCGVPQRFPSSVGAVLVRCRGGPPPRLRPGRGGARLAAGRRRPDILGRGSPGHDRPVRVMTTTTATVALPEAGGSWREIELSESRTWAEHPQAFQSRIAFAAAHVVADPRGENVPGAPATIDWEATLAFRRHLFSYGLGVAEAMDTAQRNMGLDWPATQELITRSAALAQEHGAKIASGAGTDQLLAPAESLDEVTRAYLEQVEFVEAAGSQAIVMASRQLAAVARSADDYLEVYSSVLAQATLPVILHWLGEMFDPQLSGYWGSIDVATATGTFLDLIRENSAKVDGVKVSLLSADHEQELRAALPAGVRLYTGDAFNYPELIEGDGDHHSDALLGAFAAIAPAASAALSALDADDIEGYRREMAPTLELSRHIFAPPTFYYKTGIAFLAWLNGHQDGFVMVGGLQSARSIVHLARVFELANEAQLLADPDLAAHRLGLLLASAGLAR